MLCRTLHECVDWNIYSPSYLEFFYLVALYTSAWIEISGYNKPFRYHLVALYTSAWIEIFAPDRYDTCNHSSHSTRVRGLKFSKFSDYLFRNLVALYTSAWIEILVLRAIESCHLVALYTSAWIEMMYTKPLSQFSHVALYTSAWIEMCN